MKNHFSMKRLAVILLAVILTGITLHAQVVPGMKYKELKNVYDSSLYVRQATDPYSPFWSGLSSLVIPGLGQMMCGEPGRGWAFLGGAFGIGVMTAASITGLTNLVTVKDGFVVYADDRAASRWMAAIIILGGAYVGGAIWSVIDAVKVAQVKNMYYQDLTKKTDVSFNMYPSLNYTYTSAGATTAAPGLTLAVRF